MNLRHAKPSQAPDAATLLIRIRLHNEMFRHDRDLRGIPTLDASAWKRLHRLVDVVLEPALTQRERERAVALGINESAEYSGQLVFWLAQFLASRDAGELVTRAAPIIAHANAIWGWVTPARMAA